MSKVTVQATDPRTFVADAMMVVLAGASARPSQELQALDAALGGEIAARRDLGDLAVGADGPVSIPGLDRVGATRLVIVSTGPEATPDEVRAAAAAAGRAVVRMGAKHVALWVERDADLHQQAHATIGAATEGLLLGAHPVRSYARDDGRSAPPDRVTVLVPGEASEQEPDPATDASADATIADAVRAAAIVAQAAGWSRDLVDAPPNR